VLLAIWEGQLLLLEPQTAERFYGLNEFWGVISHSLVIRYKISKKSTVSNRRMTGLSVNLVGNIHLEFFVKRNNSACYQIFTLIILIHSLVQFLTVFCAIPLGTSVSKFVGGRSLVGRSGRKLVIRGELKRYYCSFLTFLCTVSRKSERYCTIYGQ
jgi:hypothetical protein